MYTEEQKRLHVYSLQNAIFQLGQADSTLPRLAPDGIYGPDTTSAVRELQRRGGLPATGRTDRATWDMIFRRYFDEMTRSAAPVALTPYLSAPIQVPRGSVDAGVGMAQVMLWALSGTFSNLHAVPLTLTLDEATLEQLHTLQRLSGLPQADVLDTATWNLLTVLFNAVGSR